MELIGAVSAWHELVDTAAEFGRSMIRERTGDLANARAEGRAGGRSKKLDPKSGPKSPRASCWTKISRQYSPGSTTSANEPVPGSSSLNGRKIEADQAQAPARSPQRTTQRSLNRVSVSRQCTEAKGERITFVNSGRGAAFYLGQTGARPCLPNPLLSKKPPAPRCPLSAGTLRRAVSKARQNRCCR